METNTLKPGGILWKIKQNLTLGLTQELIKVYKVM